MGELNDLDIPTAIKPSKVSKLPIAFNSGDVNLNDISNLFGDLTGGTEWPTTLFFQYKFKINTGGEV